MNEQTRLYFLIGGLAFAFVLLAMVLFSAREEKMDLDEGMKGFQCGDEFVHEDDAYKTVKIGEQCWMAENLRTTVYRDGNEIPNPEIYGDWSEAEKGGWACYQNKEENCEKYGALYNWYAVGSVHGLCPAGWEVPDSNQWADMKRTVCENLGHENCEREFPYNGDVGWRGTEEGFHLMTKEAGGENTYGFSAQLSGFRNTNGPFSQLHERGFWWVPEKSSEGSAKAIFVEEGSKGIRIISSRKNSGMSVRCVSE